MLLERGDRNAARVKLLEAAEVLEETGTDADPSATAYLAQLDERDLTSIEVDLAEFDTEQAEAHLALFCAAGDRSHLSAARDALERMSGRLSGPETIDRILRHVRSDRYRARTPGHDGQPRPPPPPTQ